MASLPDTLLGSGMWSRIRKASTFLSNLSCCAGSTVVIVVNGKPTDDMIVRKSLGLTRVLRQAM